MSNLNDISQILFGRSSKDLDEKELRVLTRSRERKILSVDTNAAFAASQSFGDRVADSIARVGGSWAFIIGFLIFLLVWAVANTILLTRDAFDPYPFIFLNLVLSMAAALQTPIIMMSQNRQSQRDRFDASKDYEVNLKSEIELIALHHKIDNLLLKEIAELKTEVMRLHERLNEKR